MKSGLAYGGLLALVLATSPFLHISHTTPSTTAVVETYMVPKIVKKEVSVPTEFYSSGIFGGRIYRWEEQEVTNWFTLRASYELVNGKKEETPYLSVPLSEKTSESIPENAQLVNTETNTYSETFICF